MCFDYETVTDFGAGNEHLVEARAFGVKVDGAVTGAVAAVDELERVQSVT